MNDNNQLPAEFAGPANATTPDSTNQNQPSIQPAEASPQSSTQNSTQGQKPKTEQPVAKPAARATTRPAVKRLPASAAKTQPKIEPTEQPTGEAQSKSSSGSAKAATPKAASQVKKPVSSVKKSPAYAAANLANPAMEPVDENTRPEKPKSAPKKPTSVKQPASAKNSSVQSSAQKPPAPKSSPKKDTTAPEQALNENQPIQQDIQLANPEHPHLDEDPPFNLHQQTDLWPEAWPDSAPGSNAEENPTRQAQNKEPGQIKNESTPSLRGGSQNRRYSRTNSNKNEAARNLSRDSGRGNYSEAPRNPDNPDAPANSASPTNSDNADNSNQNNYKWTGSVRDESTGFDPAPPEQVHNSFPQSNDESNAELLNSSSDSTDNSNQSNRQKSSRNGNNASRGTRTQKTTAQHNTESQPKPNKSSAPGKKKWNMYISVLPGEQIEVVITEGGQVQEYYVQMLHQLKTKGNIYKGVIHNVDANLQAAFVSYGAVKNGFLQIDEVHPEYYLAAHETAKGKKYPLIQKVLKAGQEVLVQVIKEPTGGKGAFLSTYLSLPGRFLVLTPGRTQLGVSRKVEDEGERERLRKLLEGLPISEGLGVIVRTASLSASKTSMLKDLQFLKRLWKEVRTKGSNDPAPCLVYEEPSLASRAVRDYLNDDIAEIWVDNKATAEEIEETVSLIFPRRASSSLIKLHSDPNKSMWDALNLTTQLEQIFSREVVLPSGGRLVFDQTEALTSIDINSGKITGRNNFESMALRTNMEAAESIAQQLRLRDIGGQIVIDFIEMRERNHWRELEKTMRNAMKSDRARFDVAKVSPFGLMELVRQRLGSSAISITMEPCPCCEGTGMRRNMEWQALRALHDIQYKLRQQQDPNTPAVYETEPEVALYLLNNKRAALNALEDQFETSVEFKFGKK